MSPRRFGHAASHPEPEIPAEQPQVVPDDLSAAAEQCRLDAEKRAADASQLRTDAQVALDDGEREAARITAAAKSKAAGITAEGASAEQEASALETRARTFTRAAQVQQEAAEADQLVSDLEAERERLAAKIADHGAMIEQAAADRLDADSRHAAARQAGDTKAIEGCLIRNAALDDLTADRASKLAAAQARTQEIGDGTVSHPGLLADARQAFSARSVALRRLLNELFPDRPEALMDAALDELRGAVAGNLARIAEASGKPEDPRTVVML